jgi:organic hydroperoxide reductase OsmC/OhrA
MLGLSKKGSMGIVKAHRYEVRAHWLGGRRLALESHGKPALGVATPPDFKDGVKDVWSPEELLVGSLATCFELTLVAIADRWRVPLHAVEVTGTGHLEPIDGRFRFLLIELDVCVTVDPEHLDEATEIALLAKDRCIVGGALATPVETKVKVLAHGAAVTAA